MTEPDFRQRLDAILRTQDYRRVQQFMIAEGQWDEGTPADPEFAMWMMIAASAALRDLHERARQWLQSHGHEVEAQALTRREKQGGPGRRGGGHGRRQGRR